MPWAATGLSYAKTGICTGEGLTPPSIEAHMLMMNETSIPTHDLLIMSPIILTFGHKGLERSLFKVWFEQCTNAKWITSTNFSLFES